MASRPPPPPCPPISNPPQPYKDPTPRSPHDSMLLVRAFFAHFKDILIEKTGAQVWAHLDPPVHLSRGPLDDLGDLEILLKKYASDLESTERSNATFVQELISIIWLHRRELLKCFLRDSAAESFEPGSQTQHDEYPLSSIHRLSIIIMSHQARGLDLSESDSRDLVEESGYGYDAPDSDEENDKVAKLATQIITRGEPFCTLVTGIRRRFYSDDLRTMRRIEYEFAESHYQKSGSNGLITAVFNFGWKPSEFFESQFEGRIPRIGSLVTLTGSAFYAQAATCAEYLKQTWPTTWKLLLSSLQSFLDAKGALIVLRSSPGSLEEFSNWYEINFSIGKDKTLAVSIKGPLKAITEVAQQLSWMSAALSLSPFGNEPAYCRGGIYMVTQSMCICQDFAELDPIENPCWLSLFSNATIAQGFPIPQRLGEVGLEISIELMAAIVGACHAVEYDGGVVMKGFSSMFIPLKRDKETNTVQWHLVSSQNKETRLSYQEGVSHCPDRILLAEFDLESLQTTRAIVGWWHTVETVLGRECINYENINYSKAGEPTRSLKIKNATVGFQQFALAQFEFTLGPKDGSCHFQRKNRYRRIIDAAGKTYVVLFDTEERLGWLVPASGVLLHIASHRGWLKKMAPFQPGDSFEEQLLQNESVDLVGNGVYRFKDMIIEVWSNLEFLVDQRVSKGNDSGVSLRALFRDKLVGYEFKAIVEDRSPQQVKEFAVGSTSGGWLSLVKSINALVLFASGFKDLIRPAGVGSGLCHMWKAVPKGKDYLATTVQTLNDLYDVAGCRVSKEYLTSSHLQWHRGDSVLFEDCHSPEAPECDCNRLQQIVPRNTFLDAGSPGHLTDEGGVIFGGPRTWLYDNLATALRTLSTVDLYSQPNIVFLYDGSEDEENTASTSLDEATTTAVSIPSSPLTSISKAPPPDDGTSERKHDNLEAQCHAASSKVQSLNQDLEQDVS